MKVDLHLAALRENRDGVVLVRGEIDAVRRGRRAELVDLRLERGDLITRLVQRSDQDLVLIVRLGQHAVDVAYLVVNTRALRIRGPSRGRVRAHVGSEHILRSHDPRPPGAGPTAPRSPSLCVSSTLALSSFSGLQAVCPAITSVRFELANAMSQ